MAYILIADDDQNYAEMAREFLASKGHCVEIVKDVFQFAAIVAKRLPSAAIIDMQMPGGGGPAAVRVLRESSPVVIIPAIICSGMPVEQARKWFPAAKRLDFLVKPLDLDALSLTLASLLAQT